MKADSTGKEEGKRKEEKRDILHLSSLSLNYEEPGTDLFIFLEITGCFISFVHCKS
jgi:hypothetical protein